MSMAMILTTSGNIHNSLEGNGRKAAPRVTTGTWTSLRRCASAAPAVILSQLDLALRAGTTQRHLSFIESGRSAPGRNMVVRLAESLELPLRERNELLLAAGYAPAYPESSP